MHPKFDTVAAENPWKLEGRTLATPDLYYMHSLSLSLSFVKKLVFPNRNIFFLEFPKTK
jgi:hypothetical protein